MFAPYIPWLGASMATGCYHIDALHARVRGIYTHTVPVDAYRGAGRPEAAYVLERLVDVCAHKLGIAPEELRARNFVKPDQMPYHTHTDRDYDVGDFEGAMRACLKKADRAGFAKRARRRAGEGQDPRIRHSRAISNAPPGARARKVPSGSTRTAISPSLIGTQSTGQGHETAYAQIVSAVSRRAARAHQGRAGRHRSDSDRQRHRRVAIDPDRRGDGCPRLGDLGRFAEGVGGRQAGGRGRRPGDRRRQGAHRRNRPRDLLRRDRGASGRPQRN